MFVSVFSPEKGIPFVVTPVCRHRRTLKYMDLQTPTHCRLVVVLTGGIFADYSELSIDGDAMFTNNWAENRGGENGRGTKSLTLALEFITAVLAFRGAPIYSI